MSEAPARMPLKKVRIGDLLLEHGIITREQLDEALAEQRRTGRKLGRLLIERGDVDEDRLLELLARQLDLPYIDLSRFEVDEEAARLLPETLARRHRALVLRREGDALLLGMSDPTDIFAFDAIARALHRPLRLAVVREDALLDAIDRVYRHGGQLRSLADEVRQEVSTNAFDLQHLEDDIERSDAPVVRLIRTLFEEAVASGASDIHLEPDEQVLRIRRRIDGVLHEEVMEERQIAPAVISRLKLMAGCDISEKRLPQDGRFTLRVQDGEVDVRLATLPTRTGESVVLRLLDPEGRRRRLEDLGMESSLQDRFRRIIHRPNGLVLVTGPTGSGKTTTLYAALAELNRPQTKIVTVEDPVEIHLPRINQVQVNPRIGLDFARVLRTALRFDPDVLLVGEIRDEETAEIALRSALTGHRVLSTLHTSDAPSAIPRLLDMGVEAYLVGAAIDAVLAQRLVRRLCTACREAVEPTPAQRAWLDRFAGMVPELPERFRRGAGCARCNHTGYRGRTGVYELLEIDEDLIEALRHEGPAGFLARARAQSGYRPLVVSALRLACAGETSLEEAMRLTGWSE